MAEDERQMLFTRDKVSQLGFLKKNSVSKRATTQISSTRDRVKPRPGGGQHRPTEKETGIRFSFKMAAKNWKQVVTMCGLLFGEEAWENGIRGQQPN